MIKSTQNNAIFAFILASTFFIVYFFNMRHEKEGWTSTSTPYTIDIIKKNDDGSVQDGYYNIPNTFLMAPLPHGYTLSKVDASGNGYLTPNTMPSDGVLPYQYYKIKNSNYIAPLPFGYKISSSDVDDKVKMSDSEITSFAMTTDNPYEFYQKYSLELKKNDFHYDGTNYDLNYHLAGEPSKGTAKMETWVIDKSGNKVKMKWNNIFNNYATYHKPKTYKYGPSSWVPNYEDSVFLSSSLSPYV